MATLKETGYNYLGGS